MAIRRLVLAALLVSAGMAQAAVVPAAASSNFLTNWTNGNGTDVIASGALSDNVTLIGGISHGASASLEDVLFGKVSAQQATSGTQLKYAAGVQGNYLLGTDNGALAARLGNSKSVVNTNDGVTVLDGITKPGLGNGADFTPALDDIPGKGIGLELGEDSNAQPAQVPEPSSVALMLAGLVGAGSLARRRKQ